MVAFFDRSCSGWVWPGHWTQRLCFHWWWWQRQSGATTGPQRYLRSLHRTNGGCHENVSTGFRGREVSLGHLFLNTKQILSLMRSQGAWGNCHRPLHHSYSRQFIYKIRFIGNLFVNIGEVWNKSKRGHITPNFLFQPQHYAFSKCNSKDALPLTHDCTHRSHAWLHT